MNKNKILDFIKKNKVAVGAVGGLLAVGILAGIGFGVHKLTSNNNDNTLAVESNEEDKPHENIESNESTASLNKNNEQATEDSSENKAEDNKETSDTTENNSDDKNISSESEQKDNKNQNDNNKSEQNKGVNAGIEISEGKTDNKVNKPLTGSTQNTDKAPSHSHSWKAVTKVIHHKEQGHYENELVKPAWTENVPVYEERARDICNTCNADLTGTNISAHVKKHMLAGEDKGGHRTEWKKVQVGTKPVKHDAVYKKKWVVDKKAYTETKITGYKCGCGATK
ncbi:hypothetical protein [Clostridium baratii]|uniref:hypothetical protein n=1 Tax=Clostridium baratii TaxID=1561 RepID=UPI0030D37391